MEWWLLPIIIAGSLSFFAFIGLMIKNKYGIKDKDAEAIKKMQNECKKIHSIVDKRLDTIEDAIIAFNIGMSVSLSCQHAVLTTFEKEGRGNGEIKQAKERFTDTFKTEYSLK